MTYDPQVLVVGGSSVGLATATFLARRGVRTTLIERRSGISVHPRALGLGPRAVEVLRAAGLNERLRAVQRTTGVRAGRVDVERVAGTDFAAIERQFQFAADEEDFDVASPADVGALSQERLDPVLADAARESGALLRFDTELVEIRQDETAVTTVVRESDGILRPIVADYVIAADGANSTVRAAIGIPCSGPGPLGDGYMLNTLFDANLSRWVGPNAFGMCGIRNEYGGSILIPIDYPHRWVLHSRFDGDIATADTAPEPAIDRVRKAIGDPDLAVSIVSTLPWRSTMRLADEFRRGRIFLVGDAAHVVPPTGGFGLNTGIPDGHNLAWKLALVLANRADPALLDSYQAERRPAAEFAQAQVLLRARNMDAHWDMNRAAEREALGIAEITVAHLGIRYASDAIIDDTEPIDREPSESAPKLISHTDPDANLNGTPGTRVPHAWVRYDGQRVSTVDLAEGAFTIFTGPDHHGWHSAATELADETGLTIRVFRVSTTSPTDTSPTDTSPTDTRPTNTDSADRSADGEDRATIVLDIEDRFRVVASLADGDAILVRPDGIVACRWNGTGPSELIEARRAPRNLLRDALLVITCRTAVDIESKSSQRTAS